MSCQCDGMLLLAGEPRKQVDLEDSLEPLCYWTVVTGLSHDVVAKVEHLAKLENVKCDVILKAKPVEDIFEVFNKYRAVF